MSVHSHDNSSLNKQERCYIVSRKRSIYSSKEPRDWGLTIVFSSRKVALPRPRGSRGGAYFCSLECDTQLFWGTIIESLAAYALKSIHCSLGAEVRKVHSIRPIKPYKLIQAGFIQIKLICILTLFFSPYATTALYAQDVLPTPLSDPAQSRQIEPSRQQPSTTNDVQSDIQTELDQQIGLLMEYLTTKDKIGQLFLISFPGMETGINSDIAELIYSYRVGGVMLSPHRGNIPNQKNVDTLLETKNLINNLQGLAYGLDLSTDQDPRLGEEDQWSPTDSLSLAEKYNALPLRIPLFIAVEQAGDGLPNTSLRHGFTPLPNQMAIGATWLAEHAHALGKIVGHELHAVGVNLLLGPNLDILDQPRPNDVGSLGTYSFGGNSYWVSQLARSYISGVHTGGKRRVATIVRHFPGQGDIDRLPEQEVATVQKEIEELRKNELQPFTSVTRQSSAIIDKEGNMAATDGLMSSHIRYSAFQGTNQGLGAPLSMTPDLINVLDQERFSEWHENGGILVSNALGVPAIRSYYADLTAEDFPIKRIAADAIIAGHDLLYLGQFSTDGEWKSEKENIINLINFFQERYEDDTTFANQVDRSVKRIIRLKYSLYGTPLLVNQDDIEVVAPTLPTKTDDPTPYFIPIDNILIRTANMRRLMDKQHQADASAVLWVA